MSQKKKVNEEALNLGLKDDLTGLSLLMNSNVLNKDTVASLYAVACVERNGELISLLNEKGFSILPPGDRHTFFATSLKNPVFLKLCERCFDIGDIEFFKKNGGDFLGDFASGCRTLAKRSQTDILRYLGKWSYQEIPDTVLEEGLSNKNIQFVQDMLDMGKKPLMPAWKKAVDMESMDALNLFFSKSPPSSRTLNPLAEYAAGKYWRLGVEFLLRSGAKISQNAASSLFYVFSNDSDLMLNQVLVEKGYVPTGMYAEKYSSNSPQVRSLVESAMLKAKTKGQNKRTVRNGL